MTKGMPFKLIAPKEIAQILAMVGMPSATALQIDQPTPEIAATMIQQVSQFAYHLEDVSRVRAQLGISPMENAEIYNEALESLIMFKLARRLAQLNGMDDFTWKDIWDPQPKRLRAFLSGTINFLRYREAQEHVVYTLRDDVKELDATRLELVQKLEDVAQETSFAVQTYEAEMPAMLEAEKEEQKCRTKLGKHQREAHAGDRLVEQAKEKLSVRRERIDGKHERIARLRAEMATLQGQVAESPSGVNQEIQELQNSIRQKKAWVEENGDVRRARALRDQALARIETNLETCLETHNKAAEEQMRVDVQRERVRKAQEELLALRKGMEALIADRAEIDERVRQTQADIERAKEVHGDRQRHLEARRQTALTQHQELQVKRTVEQGKLMDMQTKRLQLEAEVAAERRAHEAEMGDMECQQRSTFDDAEAYANTIDSLLASYGGSEVGNLARRSDQRLQRQVLQGLPSPAREKRASRSPGSYIHAGRSPLF